MSKRSLSLPENQQPLFEGIRFDPKEYAAHTPFVPWKEYGDAKNVAMVMAPEKGPSVDIEKRDSALIATLGHLAHASMMIGLQNVAESDPDSPIRKKIETRYGEDAPEVLGGAPTVQREHELGARNEFMKAYGYRQMIEAGSAPVEVSGAFVEDFDKFQDRYYGRKGNKNRAKLRKQIRRNQEVTKNTEYVHRAVRKQATKS